MSEQNTSFGDFPQRFQEWQMSKAGRLEDGLQLFLPLRSAFSALRRGEASPEDVKRIAQQGKAAYLARLEESRQSPDYQGLVTEKTIDELISALHETDWKEETAVQRFIKLVENTVQMEE